MPVTRAVRALTLTAVLLVLSPALEAAPVRAAAVLSDGSVAPPSGTTATVFAFTVHYTSIGSPSQPAGGVSAQVGSVTIPMTKVSGSANDGTWQVSATLPAGTWQVTFIASTSDPQPDPLIGPIVTVTDPPPPTPSPSPPPTATPTPAPTAPPQPTPLPTPIPTPRPAPRPTQPPPTGDDPGQTPSPSPSPSPTPTGSPRLGTATPTPSPGDEPDDGPSSTPVAAAQRNDAPSPTSSLASFLIVGGTMSLAGAAVLARQWYVSRRGSAP